MSGKATTLRWSAGPRASEGSTPTIKNHTATRIGSRLFVFGGYDGVRNHHAVHVLDTETLEWREAEVHVSFHVALVFRCRFAGHSCARCPLVFFFPVSFCLLSPSPSLPFLTCVYFPDKFSNQPLLFFLDIIIKRTLYEHYTNIIRTLYEHYINNKSFIMNVILYSTNTFAGRPTCWSKRSHGYVCQRLYLRYWWLAWKWSLSSL